MYLKNMYWGDHIHQVFKVLFYGEKNSAEFEHLQFQIICYRLVLVVQLEDTLVPEMDFHQVDMSI